MKSDGKAAILAVSNRKGIVVIVDNADPLRYRADEIADISDRVGSVRRRLTFADGCAFETDDNDSVDELAALLGKARSLLPWLERFHPRLVLFAIAAIALIVLVVRYGLPAMANFAAQATPPAAARLIDTGLLQTADRTLLSPTRLPTHRQTEIEEQLRALIDANMLDDIDVNLRFRDSAGIGANAIALPGGTVVLTDGLVELARSDDELLAVLAHEIAHIEARHGLRQLYRAIGLAVFVLLIAGDPGEIAEEVVAQGSLLLTLSYSRQFEAAADRRSVEMMTRAGRDGAALAAILGRLAADMCEDCDNWLSSHPATATRMRTIREISAAN